LHDIGLTTKLQNQNLMGRAGANVAPVRPNRKNIVIVFDSAAYI